MRLLAVERAMSEVLPRTGTKVIICLSVSYDLYTYLLSNLVKF